MTPGSSYPRTVDRPTALGHAYAFPEPGHHDDSGVCHSDSVRMLPGGDCGDGVPGETGVVQNPAGLE